MCKAKSCKYYKTCIVKRECTDFCCGDYVKGQDKKVKKEKK
jgi:hypothetical protein